MGPAAAPIRFQTIPFVMKAQMKARWARQKANRPVRKYCAPSTSPHQQAINPAIMNRPYTIQFLEYAGGGSRPTREAK